MKPPLLHQIMKHAEASSAQTRIRECDEPNETAPVGLSRGRGHVHSPTSHDGGLRSGHHGKFVHSHLQRSTNPAKYLRLGPQSPAFTRQDLAIHSLITSVFNALLAQYHAMELERRSSGPVSTRSQGFRHKMKYSEVENVRSHRRSYSRIHMGYKFEGPFGSSPECFLMGGTPHVNAAKIHALSSERERGTGEMSDNGPLWTMECLSVTRPRCEFHKSSSQGLGAIMHTTTSGRISPVLVSNTELIVPKLVAFTTPTDSLDTLKISPRQHHKFLTSSQERDSLLGVQTKKKSSSGHYNCYPHSADPPIYNYDTTLQSKSKQTTTSQQNNTGPESTASRQQQVVSLGATVIRFAAYVHLVQETARIIIELRNATIAAVHLALLRSIYLTNRAREITSIHSKKMTAEMDSDYHYNTFFFEDINYYELPTPDIDFFFQPTPDMSSLESSPTLLNLSEEPQFREDPNMFHEWINYNECVVPSAALVPEVFDSCSPASPPPPLYHSSAPTENSTPAAAGSPSYSPPPYIPVPASVSPPVIPSTPSAPPPPASATTPKRYPCPHPGCPKTDFPRPCDQRKHYKVHLKNYLCDHPDCSKGFPTAKDLRRHKTTVHDRLKPYICRYPECRKAHSRLDNLKEHERRHQRPGGMSRRGRAARSPSE